MSYDLEIFNGNPEDAEETFAHLDCRLVWHTLKELLPSEKIEFGEDELVWFLPTRTVSMYLGREDETVQTIAAMLVLGDRSEETELTYPPKALEDPEQVREDLSRVIVTLLALADKLGAQVYDPQNDMIWTHDKVSDFVDNFDHDEAVMRVMQQHLAQGDVEGAAIDANDGFTPENETHTRRPTLSQSGLYTIISLIIVVGFVGMKLMHRAERNEARQNRMVEQQEPARYPGYQSAPTQSMRTGVPSARIWLAEDYTINRSDLENAEGTRALTWVIQANGNTMLERNAKNEMQYRYYRLQPGVTYTVYLKAFFDGAYHTVSNVLSFQVP
ncbi:MAG: hypothetical protein MK052_05730 [Alphaproteobacteria bacterium]|nr:hypothetical protein [Alphaproteobacteria bacterium]